MWGIGRSKAKINECTDSYTLAAGGFYLQNSQTLQREQKQYTLYPNGHTGDLEFPTLSLEIASLLFQQDAVITCVTALYSPDKTKHPSWWKESFPYRLNRFLDAYDLTSNTFFDGEKSIATITSGINLSLMKLLIGSESYEFEGNQCVLYGYSDKAIQCDSFEEVRALIASNTFVVSMEYHENHDYLESS